jgi:hypothetical protein
MLTKRHLPKWSIFATRRTSLAYLLRFQILNTVRFLLASSLAVLCSCQSVQVEHETHFSSTAFQNELSADERIRWLNERWNYFRSFYQVIEEPYFGKTGNDGGCETRSVDEIVNLENKLFIGKSARVRTNSAGVLGLCREEDQTHVLRIVFIACTNRSKQFDLKRICQHDQCQIDAGHLRQLCKSERAD